MTVHDGEVASRICPACRSDVPAGVFCGDCGARFGAPVTRWGVLLRPNVFATAHRETIWLPRISSTLFPRFPGQLRRPFRIGLILVLIAIIGLALARLNGPLGVTAALGAPLLFLLYVWQSDAFRDIPLRVLAVAAVLGAAFGAGWWLAVGKFLARSYDLSTASSLALTRVLNTGFLITLGGAVLMLAPAVLCRLIAVPVRESLDGFVVGAVGALCYATAATTTIVGPQFAEGLLEGQSTGRMLHDSITYGVVNPIATTAAGGLVGLSLWFQPDRRTGRDPRRARVALTLFAVLGVGSFVAVWTIDAMSLTRPLDMALKLVVAGFAVFAIRCAVQTALLHEAPDPVTGSLLLCVHCEKVVPDMPFCSACGAAAKASSRTSRRLRRADPPVRLTQLSG